MSISGVPVLLDRLVPCVSPGPGWATSASPTLSERVFAVGLSLVARCVCLLAPPLVSFSVIFPTALRKANSSKILLIAALLALVNGPREEILWRGTYLTLFPGDIWLGLLSSTTGFALWHFAPQSIFPSKGPGGRSALVVEVWFLGLLWAWVANNTGVISWTAIAHVLIDFSAVHDWT